MAMTRLAGIGVVCLGVSLFWGCSAGSDRGSTDSTGSASSGSGGDFGTGGSNGFDCDPGTRVCVGNEVHECGPGGMASDVVLEICDPSQDLVCNDGECVPLTCDVAAEQPSNIGCEFWAVDLDQQDSFNDPANAPWGIVLSNAGGGQANVTIEINEAVPGDPLQLTTVEQVSVPAGALSAHYLPTREIDCGVAPNDYASPGTCLSSKAFRITSSAPIVAYQFNVFENAFSRASCCFSSAFTRASCAAHTDWSRNCSFRSPSASSSSRSQRSGRCIRSAHS